jgi:transposase
MIGEHLGDEEDDPMVAVRIETERGRGCRALIAAGYQIYAINPLQVARYRERRSVSVAKSDTGDAHLLADMVRTDRDQLRPVAGDSVEAEAVKVLTPAHKTRIRERTRRLLRLREYFPAALIVFDNHTAIDTLELLGVAPNPASAAALTTEQITAALARARRHDRAATADAIAGALRAEHLDQPAFVTAAGQRPRPSGDPRRPQNRDQDHGETGQITFGRNPGAEIDRGQPGLGAVPGASSLLRSRRA